jgi:hypothetical protein
MFARLVETGLVGTSGTATEPVHQQVVESFNGNKALVLAALFGEDMPQSKRNTEKRISYDVVDHGFVARRGRARSHTVCLIGRYPGDRLLLPFPQGTIRHGVAMPRFMTLRA